MEWISNGGQKPVMSISNTGSILPVTTTVLTSVIQSGGALFQPVSGDMTRTYHTSPQVRRKEVYILQNSLTIYSV